MIFGRQLDFFIQTDILIRDRGYCMGPLIFWIDGKAYPGEGVSITLNSEIFILKDNLNRALSRKFPESNLPLNEINFEKEEISEENIMYCYLSELSDYGLKVRCEIVKEKFRFFYSLHNSDFKLKEININYYKEIIDGLFDFILNNCSERYPK